MAISVNGEKAVIGRCMIDQLNGCVGAEDGEAFAHGVTLSHRVGNCEIRLEKGSASAIPPSENEIYSGISIGHTDLICFNRAYEFQSKTDSTMKLDPTRVFKPAAVMCVIDNQKRVLMTRRADHMRAFPKAWVYPGGHVDYQE